MEKREREGRREEGRGFRGRVFPSLLVLVTASVCGAFPVSHRHRSTPWGQTGWGVIPIFQIGRLRLRAAAGLLSKPHT